MPRLLLLTTEPPPLPGIPTTGAGMRAWGLACGLRAAGFEDVTLAFAADAVRGRSFEPHAVSWVRTVERAALDEFIAAHRPDALVFQHWGLMAAMKRDVPCPIAIDLAGPHLLERRLWGSRDPEGDRREKIAALSRADFVVCSGEFQRRYFLPFLFEAGFDARNAALCPAIPFSMSPELPESPAERDSTRLFYGGMFLPWQDPERLLRSTLEVLEQTGKGKLVFAGGPHPAGDISGGRFEALLDALEKHPMVERHPVMPFPEYVRLLSSCGVALDLLPRNAERELAFPTRTVTYLWAGLPAIHNDYDELAAPIDSAKAGWILPPENDAEYRKLLARLLSRAGEVAGRAENARRLVQQRYSWDRTIAPLAQWCGNPTKREGKIAPRAAAPPVDAGDVKRGEGKARTERKRGAVRYAPAAPVTGPGPRAWLLSPIVFLIALPVSMALVFFFMIAELAKRFLLRR